MSDDESRPYAPMPNTEEWEAMREYILFQQGQILCTKSVVIDLAEKAGYEVEDEGTNLIFKKPETK